MSVLAGMSREGQGLNLARVSKGGRLATIEYAHMAVHEDGFVTATEYVADLDIIGPRTYYIKPLAGFALHSVFLIKSSSAVRVQIYEDPTVTGDGTRLAHMRNNRNSAIADNARDTTYHTPTANPDGDLIYDSYSGGASGLLIRAGGESRQGEEIILNPAKGYLVRVTATVDNTILSMSHEYYEVPA